MKLGESTDTAAKVNWVLHLVLIALLLIAVRLWHLAVIQREQKVEEAAKPQRKVLVEPAKRGTIRDRFNIPLAINKVQYNAAILYSQIRQIPSVVYVRDAAGKRVRRFKRREYIERLSQLLGEELGLDPLRIEDLIHAKGSFFQHIPFVIKEDVTEEQYYRLKMLEREWLGICMSCAPKRHYPKGKLACDILGYMGAINRKEYEAIVHEMNHLQESIAAREAGEDPPLPGNMESPMQVRARLKELQERAYTLTDYVGKMGVEERFEETLRGFHGKRSFYSDARGNFLREFPGGREPLSGQRLLLTISAELQRFAEHLLIQNEQVRRARISGMNLIKQEILSLKEPWIKGGAIVAMDPNNGEILALATHPRFDPNDFILTGDAEVLKRKKAHIGQWFEMESYIGAIWDQKVPMTREVYRHGVEEEELTLTWEAFLDFVLPPFDADGEEHAVRRALERVGTIKNALELQQQVEKLLTLSGQSDLYWLFQLLYERDAHKTHGAVIPEEIKMALVDNLSSHKHYVEVAKEKIDPYLSNIPSDYDKALLVDLCRLAVCGDFFTKPLLEEVGEQSLSFYRDATAAFATVEEVVHQMAKELFHALDFQMWREESGKEFLKRKRQEEKEANRYAKPYIDYFDAQERVLFHPFWEENKTAFLRAFLTGEAEQSSPYIQHFLTWQKELSQGAHPAIEWRGAYEALAHALPSSCACQYLKTLRKFKQLDRPLLGRYRSLRSEGKMQLEKHLAASFYPRYGFGYGRSYAYRQTTHQGSLFKLVTAYEALVQRYRKLSGEGMCLNSAQLNPLEMVDMVKQAPRGLNVGYHLDGSPIPQLYKGGRIPKSAIKQIGRVDLLRALEVSSNPYFALLAGDVLDDPRDLERAAYDFSYGERTGLDLPCEIKGKVPSDLASNRTGLYAFSIGHHTFIATPIQTAVMLSSLANGGKILKPKLVRLTAGSQFNKSDASIPSVPKFPYQESLSLVGIDFPLFTAAWQQKQQQHIEHTPTTVKRELFMPEVVRRTLLEGMHRVMHRSQTEGVASIRNLYTKHPRAMRDFLDLKSDFVAKTSTSESVENVNLDAAFGTHKFNHTWFGGISFQNAPGEGVVVSDPYGNPELVVVVYLRFGEWGKDAGPVAAQLVKKWREINKS